jgi:hypothetical protein
MHWRRVVLALAGLALCGGAAEAACRQGDLTGTHTVYVFGIEPTTYAWVRCQLRIAAGGAVRAGTRCLDDEGDRATVGGGTIRVNQSCVVTGQFRVGDEPDVVTVRIEHATLLRSKDAFAGVGRADDFIFQLTGVKN